MVDSPPPESLQIQSLLDRSCAFEDAVLECFPEVGFVSGATNRQGELVATACVLSAEHGRAVRAAFAHGAPNAGAALLRLQYEALLRAVWLMFAAIPPQVDALDRSLDLEDDQKAGSLPNYIEMLESVVRRAPLGISAPLAEFNQYSRQALRAQLRRRGVPPLHGANAGYLMDTAATVIRFSNALMHFSCRLLASLSDNEERMDRVTDLYVAFADCVPMPQSASGGNVC